MTTLQVTTRAPRTATLIRRGFSAGVVAAAATVTVAAIARSANVSLEVEGTPIPVVAFGLWTLIGAAVGVLMARFTRPPCRFLVSAVVATGLSIIPALALPDDMVTKAVLVAAHVLAAGIIIPVLYWAVAPAAGTARSGVQ